MIPPAPQFPSATRTAVWLDACQRSLDEAEDAARALAREGRGTPDEIALLRLRIEALRADIRDWQTRIDRRDEELEPYWTQQPTPWCPPPPETED